MYFLQGIEKYALKTVNNMDYFYNIKLLTYCLQWSPNCIVMKLIVP